MRVEFGGVEVAMAKVHEVFDRVSRLPRRQQEHIVNWVSAFIKLPVVRILIPNWLPSFGPILLPHL